MVIPFRPRACGLTLREGQPRSDVGEVLDGRRAVEVRTDQATPRGEPLGGAEVVEVRVDGVPLEEEDEARRRLDAARHAYRSAAGGLGERLPRLAVGGGELVLLAGYDIDQTPLKHHAGETTAPQDPRKPEEGGPRHAGSGGPSGTMDATRRGVFPRDSVVNTVSRRSGPEPGPAAASPALAGAGQNAGRRRDLRSHVVPSGGWSRVRFP